MKWHAFILKKVLIIGVILLTTLSIFTSVKCVQYDFAAEVSKMMGIIINSMYKHQEIFLRELIANASDALDKLRYIALTDNSLLDDTPLQVKIRADPVSRTLTILDNGIGMTEEEMIKNLGTIARSGTQKFNAQFADKKDAGANLIGQFGVGFYSSFLAGDVVEVVSLTQNGTKNIWRCDRNQGPFTVEACPEEKDAVDPVTTQGTKVIIHLKPVDEDTPDYTSEGLLKDLIHRYSEFINFPIYLFTRKTVTEEVPLTDSELEAQEASAKKPETEGEDVKVEDAKDEEKKDTPKKTTKTVTKTVEQYERINVNPPIWTRNPSTVTEEEHRKFYKGFTNDTQDPYDYSHFQGETPTTDFRALIYIPKKPSFQLLSNDTPSDFLKLFVKRIFISSEFPDFPRYLSFIKALVDVDDIPLNVSRETLQKTKVVQDIKKSVISKTMALIKKMSEDEKSYMEFYNTYGTHLKLGVVFEQDDHRKKELSALLRFHSSAMTGKNMTSFDGYIERMQPGQKDIYYVSGTDISTLKQLPYVEALFKRKLEVIFMIDTYDESTLQALPTYKEKTLKNVVKGGIEFSDETEETKKLKEEATAKFKFLTEYFQKLFSKKIEKVVISNLLDKSPIAIVANPFGWSPAMEALMKQNSNNGDANPMAQFFGKQKKIMEINPNHPLIIGLLNRLDTLGGVAAAVEDKVLEKDMRLLYDAALMHSGYELKNPASFAHRVEDMIRIKYGIEPLKEQEPEEEEGPAANPMDIFSAMNQDEGMGNFDFSNMPDFGGADLDDSAATGDAHEAHEDHEHEHNDPEHGSTGEKEDL